MSPSLPADALTNVTETPFSIPLLSLKPYYERHEHPENFKAFLKQVDLTLKETGFMCIEGTKIPTAQIKTAQDIATQFFDLAQASKDESAARLHATRGYTGLGALGLSYAMDKEGLKQDRAAPPDLFERYRIGPVDVFEEDRMKKYGGTAYAPNVWPTAIPSFQPAMVAYYQTMNQLSRDLLRIFALALGLQENWFEAKVNRSMASLAINHYPAQTVAPLPGQLRAGAHTDYGTLTIVAPTSAAGGLQVRTKQGLWEDVSVSAGAFVVNIGDMMAQWTNDRWVSTVHRVVNPPAFEASMSRRLSMVFFHQPNPDALIECIPTCQSETLPAKFEPVNAGDYITQKINRHFKSYLAA